MDGDGEPKPLMLSLPSMSISLTLPSTTVPLGHLLEQLILSPYGTSPLPMLSERLFGGASGGGGLLTNSNRRARVKICGLHVLKDVAAGSIAPAPPRTAGVKEDWMTNTKPAEDSRKDTTIKIKEIALEIESNQKEKCELVRIGVIKVLL